MMVPPKNSVPSTTFQDGFLTFPFIGIIIGYGTQFLSMGINEPLGVFIHQQHSS
jgi:hypothetical protein